MIKDEAYVKLDLPSQTWLIELESQILPLSL